ncbi:hypothetical protein [Dysgonomonas sp.]
MKKIFLLIIGLLNITFITGQTYSSIVSDKEICDFLTWMSYNDKRHKPEPKPKNRQIYYKILKWDINNFIPKDSTLINKYKFDVDQMYIYTRRAKTDTIFDKEDRNFILEQFKAVKDSIWHNKFTNTKLLKNKSQTNSYYYSIPLFSLDKKYVIIHKQFYCGSLCAYGGYYLYRKVDEDNWEYVTTIHGWVS